MLYRSYLSKEVLRGFDSYRYSCQDTSPLSNYLMHPFWNQVVKLCPLWIAPNLLTFVGFLCCVAHYLLPAAFDYGFLASSLPPAAPSEGSPAPSWPSPIPSWVWFVSSLLLFFSHTLDGIDGKQARRTQTSSPLGELFDHGCDSWSTVYIASTFYSVFGCNEDGFSISPYRMYLVLWSVFFTFHISHWEKYNTGVMYLPWSYDLAMLGGTILYLVTGIMGYQLWKVHLPGDLSAGPILELVLYAGCYVVSFPIAVKNIVDAYRKGEHKQTSFFGALRPLVSFFAAFGICLLWATLSKNNILLQDARCFFFMSGTLYANMSCRLIVAQMSGTRSELLNHLLWPLALAVLGSLCVPGMPAVAELIVLYLLTVVILGSHLHFVVCVVIQMCDYLKIRCFQINPSAESRRKKKN